MSRICTHKSSVDFEEPALVEGFPGVGLVGKIATDHLIDQLEMDYYASVHCEGLPRIGIYRRGDGVIRPPVRLYVSEEANLFALQSDVPIGSQAVKTVAECLTGWILEHDATPLYLSGLPTDWDDRPDVFGVATGDGIEQLEANGIDFPPEDGAVSGPTGALLNRAAELEVDSLGLVVECSPQFPDPKAASVLIEETIAPIADIDVNVEDLIDRAAEIRQQREAFARRMREMGEAESTQAQPLRMYQ